MNKFSLLLLCFLYIVSPIDFIPDFLFPIGICDDLAVLGGTISKLLHGGGNNERVAESRQLARKEEAE